MIKRKNKDQIQQNITVWFGYSLFALLIAGIVFSTIVPWIGILLSPGVIHLNAVVFLVALVAGAVFPALISYIIGDRLTPGKNATLHHYNGVLFGFLSYWLALFFSIVGSYSVDMVRDHVSSVAGAAVVNGWPIVATVLVVTVLGITYARTKSKKSVLHSKQYQAVLLITALLVGVVLPLVSQIGSSNFFMLSLLSPVAFLVTIVVSYAVLRGKRSPVLQRLSSATLATTVLMIALYVTSQLIQYAPEVNDPRNIIFSVLAGVVSIGAWIGYLGLLRRTQ